MTGQRPGETLKTRLNDIAHHTCAKDNQALNLMCLFNVENMRVWFGKLRKGASPGVDEMTYEEYEVNLDENLEQLEQMMRQWSYRPQPSLRVYIPKENGKQRPLGIPALEDKIIQQGMKEILEAVYEPLFLDCSYGFRPELGCYDALKAVDRAVMQKPTNWIIDADISSYFDTVDHEWLVEMMELKIGDKQFIRLIKRFLKAGIVDEGLWRATKEGTPQGGIISPILGNIYLHYVLDLWVEKAVKPWAEGFVALVRYADDLLVCVQKKREAYGIYEALGKRLEKFGLKLSREKTKIIPFGRYAEENAKRKGRKPETFEFLGFTHYNGRTRKGSYKLDRRTIARRFTAKLMDLKEWIKKARYAQPRDKWWRTLKAKLRGHYQYFGISGNLDRIRAFGSQALHIVIKWVSRMSQKRHKAKQNLLKYLARNPLPEPKIHVNLWSF